MWTRIDLVAWALARCADEPPLGGRRRVRVPADTEAGASSLPFASGSLERWLADQGADAPAALAATWRARAVAECRAAEAVPAGLVTLADEAYPLALRDIPDRPPVLWVRGVLPAAEHAVAIVGSRAATPQALAVAAGLAEDLARAGVAVVSGLARGVDGAAHRGALRGAGRTIAVLGSGVDVAYPPEHALLAADVVAAGALVSELPLGAEPRPWHFPRRNRIISGLAAGVVVVEASAHSGSLITAGAALDQGRTVMAVPGGVLGGRNRGAHALIRDGARVVESARDILEELHGVGSLAALAADGTPGEAEGRKSPHDPLLWAMSPGEPYDVGFLAGQTGTPVVAVLSRLADLELGGWVARAGGGRFVRLRSNVLR